MQEKHYNDGDIIFHEGEAAESCFEIANGTVELQKVRGPRHLPLAELGRGEIFGEMSLLDNGPRASTAIARGPVTLRVIAKQDFRNSLTSEPDLAMRMLEKLAKRIRETDDVLADMKLGKPGRIMSWGGGESFFSKMLATLTGTTAHEKRLAGATTDSVRVLVADLENDTDGAFKAHIMGLLTAAQGIDGIGIYRHYSLDKNAPLSPQLAAAETNWRKVMEKEDGDLVIWGRVNADTQTITLHFSPAKFDDMQTSFFQRWDRLTLPLEFGDNNNALLLASVLAAAAPGRMKLGPLSLQLGEVIDGAKNATLSPSRSLQNTDIASLITCYAHVAGRIGVITKDTDWLNEALRSYDDAISRIGRESDPLEWSAISRHRAVLLEMLGERENNLDYFYSAAETLRSVVPLLSEKLTPIEWGDTQFDLGRVLYKAGMRDSETPTLKGSIEAMQKARRGFTPHEQPHRWAEVMNEMAKPLQVLGSMLHSQKMLQQAVEACQASVKVQSVDSDPMTWAQTMNNLGSAMFLLAKNNEDEDLLRQSGRVFHQAMDVFDKVGAVTHAKITRRNIAMTEKLLVGIREAIVRGESSSWHAIPLY